MKTGAWEVRPLEEATRLLFDGVAETIRAVAFDWNEVKRLPQGAQSALSIAGMLYSYEPEEYVERAKGPMSAHLANTSPALAGGPVRT
jgi:hypothetical protein